MEREPFYINNNMSVRLEHIIDQMDSLEEFEKKFPTEFLDNDTHIGNYLRELLWKYDKKASVVSRDAMLAQSYVGNIINGKKRNPSRDALIAAAEAGIAAAEAGTGQKKQKKENNENQIAILAQAFYGNRTGTRIDRRDVDRFILGHLSAEIKVTEKIDRTIVRGPGSDSAVLVYNKYQEERRREEAAGYYKEDGYEAKPPAVIPELGLKLYSRCIACSVNAEGELVSLRDEDAEKVIRYLAQ